MPTIKKKQTVDFDGLQVDRKPVYHEGQYILPVVVKPAQVAASSTENVKLHSAQTKLHCMGNSKIQAAHLMCLVTSSGAAGGNIHLKANGSTVETIAIPASIVSPTVLVSTTEHINGAGGFFEVDIENLDGGAVIDVEQVIVMISSV